MLGLETVRKQITEPVGSIRLGGLSMRSSCRLSGGHGGLVDVKEKCQHK